MPAPALGEAASREQQQRADGRRAGRGGGSAAAVTSRGPGALRAYFAAPLDMGLEHSFVLRFLNVGRVRYMGRGNKAASVHILLAPLDDQCLLHRNQYVRGTRSLSMSRDENDTHIF